MTQHTRYLADVRYQVESLTQRMCTVVVLNNSDAIIDGRKYNPMFIDLHSTLGHIDVAYYFVSHSEVFCKYLRVLSLLQHMYGMV